MTQLSDNTTIGPVTYARERALLVMACVLAILALSSPLWLPAWDVVKAGFGDTYTLYRAAAEKRHLEEFNRRLTSELVALRTRMSHKAPIEQQLEEKLTVLEEAVENATSLGFFKRGRGSEGQVLASNDGKTPKSSGSLAAIVKNPALSKGSRSSKLGVGGAEVPCEDAPCLFGARKKDISLQVSTKGSSFEVPAMTSMPDHRERLMARAGNAARVLRILPIGSPANGEVSSEYGRRRSPFSGHASFHEGIDLSLSRGDEVVSTGAGKVARVAYNRTYGVVVDIEHAPGLVTRYAHLSKATVKPGQTVERGDLIALSGSTGRSTAPHLHYEILHRGKSKNPRRFIELADELSALGVSAP